MTKEWRRVRNFFINKKTLEIMKKKNLWLLASLFAAVFTLSACGDDDEPEGPNTPSGPVTTNDLVGTWTINSTDDDYVATFTQDQVTFKMNGEVQFRGGYTVTDGVVKYTWEGGTYESVPGLLYDKSVLVMKETIKSVEGNEELLSMILFKQGKTVNAKSEDIQGFWCWYSRFGEQTIIRTAIKIQGSRFELTITPWGERYIGTYSYKNGILKLNVSEALTSREEHTGYGELWGRMDPLTLECDDWRPLDEEHWHVDAVSDGPFIANGNEAYGFVANLPAIFQKKLMIGIEE
jgi:hypothetical protein